MTNKMLNGNATIIELDITNEQLSSKEKLIDALKEQTGITNPSILKAMAMSILERKIKEIEDTEEQAESSNSDCECFACNHDTDMDRIIDKAKADVEFSESNDSVAGKYKKITEDLKIFTMIETEKKREMLDFISYCISSHQIWGLNDDERMRIFISFIAGMLYQQGERVIFGNLETKKAFTAMEKEMAEATEAMEPVAKEQTEA